MRSKKEYFLDEISRCISLPSYFSSRFKYALISVLPVRSLYKHGILFNPAEIALGLTNECNLNCIMCENACSGPTKRSSDTLSFSKYKELLREIRRLRPNQVTIGVGEPLLYDEFVPFLAYVNKLNISLKIYTNGQLLEGLAQAIIKYRVQELDVSIDGLAPIHDKIRGKKGSFQKAIAGLRKIVRLRNEKDGIFPKIRVNCTITPENYDNIDAFSDFISAEDIDLLCFFHLFYYRTQEMLVEQDKNHVGYAVSKNNKSEVYRKKIDLDILYRNIDYIKDKYQSKRVFFIPELNRKGLQIYYNSPGISIKKAGCKYPWSKISIMPNGEAKVQYRCVDYVIGNVKKAGIKKTWKSDRFHRMRKHLLDNEDFPICSRCCGSLK